MQGRVYVRQHAHLPRTADLPELADLQRDPDVQGLDDVQAVQHMRGVNLLCRFHQLPGPRDLRRDGHMQHDAVMLGSDDMCGCGGDMRGQCHVQCRLVRCDRPDLRWNRELPWYGHLRRHGHLPPGDLSEFADLQRSAHLSGICDLQRFGHLPTGPDLHVADLAGCPDLSGYDHVQRRDRNLQFAAHVFALPDLRRHQLMLRFADLQCGRRDVRCFADLQLVQHLSLHADVRQPVHVQYRDL